MLPTQPKPKNENNFSVTELVKDNKDRFEQWRLLNPKFLTDREKYKMDKVHAIYKRELSHTLPVALELVKAKKSYFLLGKVKGFEAKIDVEESDWQVKKWLDRMKDSNGIFRYQAEQIIKICCNFQQIKKERHRSSGFMTDPENLFCEELKYWAADKFCNLEANEINKETIMKRIRYLEEILCEDDLFDRPASRVSHTVQQVLVAVRGVLKYHTIPVIDKKLIHADATAGMEQIMKHILIIISDCSELLWHALRNSVNKNGEDKDKSAVLLRSVLNSPDICHAIQTTSSNILNDSEKKPSEKFIALGPGGRVMLHEDFVLPLELRTGSSKLLEVSNENAKSIFVGEESGLESKFRENAMVAKTFLKAHAYLLELGNLYGVLEKAKDCAQTGGTLLVYGIANAQLNALLELSDSLINSMHTTTNTIVCIAESRFSELVYSNSATTSRCPWIAHFKQLPALLAKIEKRTKLLLEEITKMRNQANSMTLYEQFQKAQQETDEFLNAADGFSKHMAEIMNVPYDVPQARDVINVPSLSQMEDVLQDEVSGEETPKQLRLAVSVKKRDPIQRRQGRVGLTHTATVGGRSNNPFDDDEDSSRNAPRLMITNEDQSVHLNLDSPGARKKQIAKRSASADNGGKPQEKREKTIKS